MFQAIKTVIADRKETTLNYKDYKKKFKVTLKRLGKVHKVVELLLR